MNLRARLRILERAAGECPECGTAKPVLLPMNLTGDTPTPEPELRLCPVCGEAPRVISLLPMRLDGDVTLGGDDA